MENPAIHQTLNAFRAFAFQRAVDGTSYQSYSAK